MKTVISKDSTVIAYDQEGQGPALILIDGALTTRSAASRPELVRLLSPHFMVISYDRRGRGDSGDTLPYAVEREIEDIEALMDQFGGSAYLFGHSSGASLGLDAAARLGQKVKKLAMYEAPYNDDPAAQQAWNQYIRQLTTLLAEDRRGDAVALFMRYVGTPEDHIEAARQAPWFQALEAIAPTLAYDHTAILGEYNPVPREKAACVKTPVLVMSGSASFPFMYETAKTLTRVIPHAQQRTLEGQTHEVAPQALAPLLIEFFES